LRSRGVKKRAKKETPPILKRSENLQKNDKMDARSGEEYRREREAKGLFVRPATLNGDRKG